MKICFLSFIVFSIFIFTSPVKSQDYDENERDEDSIPLVTEYEKYNKILGGDSVRYCNGVPCKGLVKDNYANGNIKHRGYYIDGKLGTVYKNFYENGQEERDFALKNYKTSTMNIFYPDGKKLSEIEYMFSDPVWWIDYYPNGQKEYEEKYHKSGEYILYRNFYYEHGQMQSSLTLINKKDNIFEKIEYYPDGVIKEKGQMLFNKSLGDYQKTGKWYSYNEKGQLILEEHYYKNKLIDDEDGDSD